jgi:hypothetical protein
MARCAAKVRTPGAAAESSTPATTTASAGGSPWTTTTGQCARAVTVETTDPNSPETRLRLRTPRTIRWACRDRSIKAVDACARTVDADTSSSGCVRFALATARFIVSVMTLSAELSGGRAGAGIMPAAGARKGHSSAYTNSTGVAVRLASSSAQASATWENVEPSYPTTIFLYMVRISFPKPYAAWWRGYGSDRFSFHVTPIDIRWAGSGDSSR